MKSWSKAAVWSAVWTFPLLTILIVWSDKTTWVYDWLTHAFGHHWVGKGILATGFFCVVTVLQQLLPQHKEPKNALLRATSTLVWVTVACCSLLVLYFAYESFVAK